MLEGAACELATSLCFSFGGQLTDGGHVEISALTTRRFGPRSNKSTSTAGGLRSFPFPNSARVCLLALSLRQCRRLAKPSCCDGASVWLSSCDRSPAGGQHDKPLPSPWTFPNRSADSPAVLVMSLAHAVVFLKSENEVELSRGEKPQTRQGSLPPIPQRANRRERKESVDNSACFVYILSINPTPLGLGRGCSSLAESSKPGSPRCR